MALPEDLDWTVRWADGRPFDPEEVAKTFELGLRGRVKAIFPNLNGWLEYGERVEATGSGRGTGRKTTGLFVATDRAFVLLVVADSVPGGHTEHLLDSQRLAYADVVSCKWKRFWALPYPKKLGLVLPEMKDGTRVRIGSILAKQADALGETLSRHLDSSVLHS